MPFFIVIPFVKIIVVDLVVVVILVVILVVVIKEVRCRRGNQKKHKRDMNKCVILSESHEQL